MKTASKEIREIVIRSYNEGIASRELLAKIFGYHIQSIGNWIRTFNTQNRISPKPKGHRKPDFSVEEQAKLVELLKTNVDITLAEIKEHFDKTCSLVAVHKTVVKLGFTYKKNSQSKRTRTQRCS